ncbi:MAG: T9SS type A sorting domain-containing protein [Bacteroidales bacterium]|nr:T9SS type A sorting domain-containing protein [Bacteroidales bacterium]
MKKISLLLVVLVASLGLFAQTQQTLAFFSFNALDSAPNTQTLIMADGGLLEDAVLYLNGTNGSSEWAPATELNSFLGSTINLYGDATNGRDLAIRNTSANNKSMVFKLSTTGFQGLVLTYAYRRSGTGFNSCVWSYSTDGVNFTTVETKNYTASISPHQLETVDMSGVANLNEQAVVYIKLTVDGCSSSSGNNRIDNVQFNAYPGGPDVYPPHVTSVNVTASNQVTLLFNEDLSPTSVMDFSNYSFDNGSTVSTVAGSGNLVVVTVAPAFTNGAPFNMFVQDVEDLAGNVMLPDTFALMYGIPDEFMCADIATLRSKLDFTGQSGSIQDTVEYELTGSVIVTATAAYNNQKVLQDETGAILVYDQNNVLGSLEVGDEISGIYCKLTNYWGFLELVPTRPYEHLVGYFQDVDPLVITLSQLNDNDYMIEHQAELIELDNVTITSTGNFAKLNRYDLSQAGVTAPALYPYFQDADYLTQPIPTGVEQNITGVNFATSKIGSSNFDFRYYIVPRFISDMTAMTSVPDYGKMQISVYPNPTVDVVRWNNCVATSAEIYDINGKKVAEQSVQNDNMVSLHGLSAGSYFLRLLNDNEVVGTAKIVKR